MIITTANLLPRSSRSPPIRAFWKLHLVSQGRGFLTVETADSRVVQLFLPIAPEMLPTMIASTTGSVFERNFAASRSNFPVKLSSHFASEHLTCARHMSGSRNALTDSRLRALRSRLGVTNPRILLPPVFIKSAQVALKGRLSCGPSEDERARRIGKGSVYVQGSASFSLAFMSAISDVSPPGLIKCKK